MSSPRGIYVRFTQAQRDALRAAQLDRLTNGDRTAMSGLAKSGSKNYPTTPNDTLFELDYADDIAASTLPPQKVANDLTGYTCGMEGCA